MNLNKDYSQMVQDVLDGNESPLVAYAHIKEAIAYLTKCKDEIEGALTESEKNNL